MNRAREFFQYPRSLSFSSSSGIRYPKGLPDYRRTFTPIIRELIFGFLGLSDKRQDLPEPPINAELTTATLKCAEPCESARHLWMVKHSTAAVLIPCSTSVHCNCVAPSNAELAVLLQFLAPPYVEMRGKAARESFYRPGGVGVPNARSRNSPAASLACHLAFAA